MPQRIGRVASVFMDIALLALIGVGLLVVGTMLPIFGTHRIFVVQSGSMEPALQVGSMIFLEPAHSYQVGDIVTWRPGSGGTPITHRIVRELPGSSLQTRGDANEAEDAPIRESQIIGKVSFSIPYLGYPVSFAKKPWGFVLIILLPSLFIVADELINIRRELSKMFYEKRRRQRDGAISRQKISSFDTSDIRKDISPIGKMK